jgi:hypothetical protein
MFKLRVCGDTSPAPFALEFQTSFGMPVTAIANDVTSR